MASRQAPTSPGELRLRRQAVRWHLRGMAFTEICQRLNRHSTWLAKWLKRFRDEGWSGLRDRSRRPHHLRAQTPAPLVDEVLAIRSILESFQDRDVEIGAAAIQRILRRRHRRVPSISTIERILRRRTTDHGLHKKAS